jgi:hypothetical protein
MLYTPVHISGGFRNQIIEASVTRSNPKYMGFLLNLYMPFVLRIVLDVGKPNRVDLPR